MYNKRREYKEMVMLNMPYSKCHPELVSGSHREPILMLHCRKKFVKARSEMLN